MSHNTHSKPARPFLKWAGGKSQLLAQIDAHLPPTLKQGRVQRYIEPFTGGGAVFFYIAQTYPVEEYVLADLNPELTLVYETVQNDTTHLIDRLTYMQAEYTPLNEAQREAYYYGVRMEFNKRSITDTVCRQDRTQRAAQIIFMNRTCYNGLFRVNAQGKFNAPFGRYKNPRICDASNLLSAGRLLQSAQILTGGFTKVEPYVRQHTFVYFDPPYRPISKTANFTAYAHRAFNDIDQQNLAAFFRRLDQTGACLMLSNSDPTHTNPQDAFFEQAYSGFRMERVWASRMINSDRSKRGRLPELLIMNY
jgi:DNA adenine methylase